MGYVDVEALLVEDSIEAEMGLPYRFGYAFDVDYTLENVGTWDSLPDGGRIWRFKITCPEAYSINLIYDYFWLPEGAQFFIYNPDHSMILGAFTSQNNKEHRKFSTSLVQGDISILEYYEPADVEAPGIINISRVVHGYKNFFSYKGVDEALGFGGSGSCNNNVNCPEGEPWQDEKRAVAMVVLQGGTRWCSGALVNNVRQDLTPYFLTANHCLGSEATWIIMFNYESPSCENIDGPTWMTISGTTRRASNSYSDFGLVELSSAPPDSYDVHFCGWTTSDVPADSSVGIHHPSGDIKKISFDYDPLTSTNYLGGPGSGDTHWRVAVWDDGTTEGGSSGSPLFDPGHHIVGQLHGGYASCTNLDADWYGKFGKSWDHGSTSATRLKDWLDPDNTGTTSLNGIDPIGISITHTPLEDTKDSLNAYEVICEIWSFSDLDADSLLLNYEINSIWASETLTSISADSFHAYIPAQSPGTLIDYNLFVKNINGDTAATETYSFYVIDYDLVLDPEADSLVGAVADTLWYAFTVTNNGVYSDDIGLEVLGNNWPTTIWDETGSTQITSTGTLAPDAGLNFQVRVIVPSSLYGDRDTAEVKTTSGGKPSISSSALAITISAGQALTIPFLDNFPDTNLNPAKWAYINGATVDDLALNEPTPLYSLDINGDPNGRDTIMSAAINLKDESNIILKYSYQQTGGGEQPDTDDDLFVEYLDSAGSWNLLITYLGSDTSMTEFVEEEFELPSGAYHSGFRIRIHNIATTGPYDNWFIDDIYVGHPSSYNVSMAPAYQSLYTPAGDSASYFLTIYNDGYLDDTYDLLDSMGSWDVIFFDQTGTTQISSTATVAPTDSTIIMVKIAVPAGTPLHTADSVYIYAISQANPMISACSILGTYSGGFPVTIPWYETFPDDTLYTQRWLVNSGAEISQEGLDEPSPPYSFNFGGGADTAITQLIDLTNKTGVLLSYYYQSTGSGSVPQAGENLYLDYRNSDDNWINLTSHLGNQTAMTAFEYVSMELPADALHDNFQLRLRTSEESAEGDWFIDNIRIDFAPEISVSPADFLQLLIKGDSAETQIVINNAGPGGLIYDLDIDYQINYASKFGTLFFAGMVEPATHAYPEWIYAGEFDKAMDVSFEGYPVKYNAGGPDNFGYYWIDSDEPGGPVYDWIEISATGTDLIDQFDDDSYTGPLNLGFDFEFYGATYDKLYIGSNGIIGFDEIDMDSRTKWPIPSSTTPNSIIAWLWDDMNPDDFDNPGAHVYVQADPDKYIIQFEDYPEYQAEPGDVITAQIILYAYGDIKLQYNQIAAGFDIENNIIGIENQDGSDGLQVAAYTDYLHTGLAVYIYRQFNWFVPQRSEGLIPAGQSDTIACMFATFMEMEEGTYTANINIHNNDPLNETITIPAELQAYNEAWYVCGDANSDEIVNVSDAVAIINYVFIPGSPVPDPLDAADANCDDTVNVSDAVYLINYIFISGSPAPCDTDGDGIPDC